VPGGFRTRVAGVEDLKDVEFATARFPARAGSFAILQRVWDLSVQHPNRRHVCVEAGLTTQRHGELDKEHFGLTVKAVCNRQHQLLEYLGCIKKEALTICDSSRTNSTTITIRAWLVSHNDDFDVITNQSICQGLR
jgi:hypothetical protein